MYIIHFIQLFIEQTGGRSTTGVGYSYGSRDSAQILAKKIERIKNSFLFD